jgi:hypothetical protein
VATDLEFKVRNKEGAVIPLNGWNIGISDFTNSMSGLVDPATNTIGVMAAGAMIPFSTFVSVDISLFLASKNSKRVSDIFWTKDGLIGKAAPANGWDVGPATPSGVPGIFNHPVTISNDDSTDPFLLTDICAVASTMFFTDLTAVPCTGSLFAPILLNPGESFTFDVSTTGAFLGNHIYFGYTMRNAAAGVVALQDIPMEIELGDHPVTEMVPEPQTLILFSCGLGLLMYHRRSLHIRGKHRS